jgi:hypothetical protein
VGTNEAKQALMTDQQLADRFEVRELPAWRDDSSFHQIDNCQIRLYPLEPLKTKRVSTPRHVAEQRKDSELKEDKCRPQWI